MTSTDPGNALFNVFCQNEYWAILRWGNMRWLGNERKRGVRVFLFWSFPGDQTSWLTNFQRGNFSEQSILHLTSMERLSFLIFFILLPVCVFLLLHFLWYGIMFEHDPSVSCKILGTKFLHMKLSAQRHLLPKYLLQNVQMRPSLVSCYISEHLDGSGGIGVEFAVLNVGDWSDKPVYNS